VIGWSRTGVKQQIWINLLWSYWRQSVTVSRNKWPTHWKAATFRSQLIHINMLFYAGDLYGFNLSHKIFAIIFAVLFWSECTLTVWQQNAIYRCFLNRWPWNMGLKGIPGQMQRRIWNRRMWFPTCFPYNTWALISDRLEATRHVSLRAKSENGWHWIMGFYCSSCSMTTVNKIRLIDWLVSGSTQVKYKDGFKLAAYGFLVPPPSPPYELWHLGYNYRREVTRVGPRSLWYGLLSRRDWGERWL